MPSRADTSDSQANAGAAMCGNAHCEELNAGELKHWLLECPQDKIGWDEYRAAAAQRV